MDYYFKSKLDNSVHDISIDDIKKLFKENQKELALSKRITQEAYDGKTAFSFTKDAVLATFIQKGIREPRTDGIRIKYPYGTIIQQAETGHYYRGENKIHKESTPTLCRRLNDFPSENKKRLYRFVADMRIGEFKSLLNKFNYVQNWNYCDILYDILAQHYGLETDWLDITSDFRTALFFATCFWDNNEKKWRPLTKERTETDEYHKYGIIFHIPKNRMLFREGMACQLFMKGEKFYSEASPNDVIYPIGFQPFMRCHMQYGYAMYMRKPHPLQNDQGFEKLRFRHDEELSKWVYEKMQGGKLIYPHEGLNEVGFIIDKIKELTVFSSDAFKYALERNNIADSEIPIYLKKLEKFCIDNNSDKNIRITDNSIWKLSSGRRQKVDNHYKDFSIEKYYNINMVSAMPIYKPLANKDN